MTNTPASRQAGAALAAVLILLAGLVGTAATSQPATARAGSFNAESFTLGNGLQVVIIPNHRAPIAVHMVWYRVGGSDEAKGKSGLAHFFEHLMYMGTKTLKPKEFSAIVARNGALENALTSTEYTYYYQIVPVDRLERMMQLEADRMQNLRLTKKVVDPERLVVLEERRGSVDNDAINGFYERVMQEAFPGHPYGLPVLGWPKDLKSVSLEDLNGFYATHYAPNNAIVIIAGDVSAAALRPMIEKTYGAVPRRKVPERAWVRQARPVPKGPVVHRDARVEDPMLLQIYPAPGINHGTRAQFYPAFLVSALLGGGTTSRLYKRLVLDREIASVVDVYFDGYVIGPANVYIEAKPQQGVSMETLEKALNEELDAIIKEGFTGPEMKRAITNLLAEAVYDTDGLYEAAEIVGQGLVSGLTLEEIDRWGEFVGAVTLDEANATARAILDRSKVMVAKLLPPVTETPGAAKGKHKEVGE